LGFYLIKRILYSVITLWVVITITFFLMHSIPGNVFASEKKLPPNIVKNLEEKYGLDKPLMQQYVKTLTNVCLLDFGMSMKTGGRSVNDIIEEHFPVSLELGLYSLFLCLLVGIPLGIISAIKKGKWQDHVSMITATLGVTIPSFVIAAILQYVFCVQLRLFPVMGLNSPTDAILPAIALSFFPISFIARLTRSSMVEVLEQDYIRTAKAKGLSKSSIIYKHALKNAILPVVTYLGPLIAGVLTGSFVIEKIFNIPGLGRYFIDTILSRDYTTIMGVTTFYASFLIIMNLVVDILYVVVDPRIKLKT
jgi:oligopeptide transport system permease protein